MTKRYKVTGSCAFVIDPGAIDRWVQPGGGYITEDISPLREEFLLNAGFLKEEEPKPARFEVKRDKPVSE